jgi:hypothetical protein
MSHDFEKYVIESYKTVVDEGERSGSKDRPNRRKNRTGPDYGVDCWALSPPVFFADCE